MNPQIYAAIDVGSNSVRLLIARDEDGFLRHIYNDRSTTRLMNGVKDGLLIGEPVENTAQAVANFVKAARRMHSAPVHCAMQKTLIPSAIAPKSCAAFG